MAEFKLGLLTDLLDMYERLESYVFLTVEEKREIIESVSDAIQITEEEFGERIDGSRNIGHNTNVGDAWHKASKTIEKYLQGEKLAKSLSMKGEAWVNMHKWSSEQLENEDIEIEQIKERLEKMTSIRRKFRRPKD
ncbi:hypothetical protein [Flavobacterium poyangense]|uniref:hypothetical protein n=1 Tax=Flavobacterium poyangense TaxID=2204302 RepID=UPI00141E4257|nr:hypothetical protein [Flavobacterium sp. JXAS1]